MAAPNSGVPALGFRLAVGLVTAAAAISPPPADAAVDPIRHVVIVVQENRTPDNLFGAFIDRLPQADLARSGPTSTGKVVPLRPIALGKDTRPEDVYDLDHSHTGFLVMYDHGRMDHADRVTCEPKAGSPCPPFPQFRYVEAVDAGPYFEIANAYGFANRMFQTNQGPSFPAHQFLLAGTSQLTATSPLFAAGNMALRRQPAGCTAPSNQRVQVAGPDGVEPDGVYPCFEHQTLTDLLDRHLPPISWRYYTPGLTSLWTAPNAIRHICQPARGTCQGLSWTNGSIFLSPPQVLEDVTDHQLRQVSWVIPDGRYSDHSGGSEGTGPAWVASVVNAIGRSSYWDSTAILITWDDWGGWYDHVAPPRGGQFGYYELGFRVPLLVVSAYTPAGYVSPVQHDFGSILRFVEHTFRLGLIPPGSFADARADNLADFFDFSAVPRPFAPIPAALPQSRFIEDKRPPTDPDDD